MYVFLTLVTRKAEALITHIVLCQHQWIVSRKKAAILASDEERVPLKNFVKVI
jgi:hypothetical protein